MNTSRFLSIICLFSAVIFIVVGFLLGEVEVGIFVVFPFIVGSGIFGLLGFILVFLAILFYFFSFPTGMIFSDKRGEGLKSERKQGSSFKTGGVVLWDLFLLFLVLIGK